MEIWFPLPSCPDPTWLQAAGASHSSQPPVVLSHSRISAEHINPSRKCAIVTRANNGASGVNTGGVMCGALSEHPAGYPSLETPSGCWWHTQVRPPGEWMQGRVQSWDTQVGWKRIAFHFRKQVPLMSTGAFCPTAEWAVRWGPSRNVFHFQNAVRCAHTGKFQSARWSLLDFHWF